MSNDWISVLDDSTLEAAVDEAMLSAFLTGGEASVIPLLPSRIAPGTSFVDPPPYWERVSFEFRILVCTTDPRYADVREQLQAAVTAAKKPATQVITALIAGAIGAHIGLFWGPLIGVVGILLLILLRVGKEAFCRRDARLANSDKPEGRG